MRKFPPERIICLTQETTEVIYLLGEEEKIIGVSGYALNKKKGIDKPKVSNFKDADFNKILTLKPDLVLAFSDVQSKIVKKIIELGIDVICFNHRDINGIFNMIKFLGKILIREKESKRLIIKLEKKINLCRTKYKNKKKINVYFEEWFNPKITCIKWVSELIEIAGGNDVFKHMASNDKAINRIVSDKDIIEKKPDIIIGSWCGKKFQANKIKNRIGWGQIPAIRKNKIFEIDSSLILSPGPTVISEGLQEIVKIIQKTN